MSDGGANEHSAAEDGSVAVGTYRSDGVLYDAFVRDQVTGQKTILGTVNDSWTATRSSASTTTAWPVRRGSGPPPTG